MEIRRSIEKQNEKIKNKLQMEEQEPINKWTIIKRKKEQYGV